MMSIFSCCVTANHKVAKTPQQTPVNTYIGKRNFLKQRHGNGIFYYNNGDIYEGEWKRDKRHGYGVYKFKTGETQAGYFKNDEYVGPSIGNSIKRKSKGDTEPLIHGQRGSVISRNPSIDGTDGTARSGRYGSIFEPKSRRLIDPRNSTLGFTADQIIQKQKEEEMMREKSRVQRENHRKSIDAMRAKYNLPAKRDSVQSLPPG